MASESNHSPILGYSDKSTVKLDFDDVSYKIVKYWANRTKNWFNLDGFIILKSSERHYHVIFDRPVTWKKNIHIINWVAVESGLVKLKDYSLMQGIKESSTIRLGPKSEKPIPRIVYRCRSQNKEIKKFLEYRKLIIQILR